MEDLAGVRFGKLEVLEELPAIRDNSGSMRRILLVKCDCGNTSEKKLKYLKNGDTTTCGNCVLKEVDKSTKGLPIFEIDPFEDELELIGNKYHEWIVIAVGFKLGNSRMLKVRCSCGSLNYVSKSVLINFESESCGCASKERIADSHKTHGLAGSKPYSVWANMRARCNNPNSTFYHNYGGRGICHQESWNSFEAFWEDMGDTYVEGLELDRIDPNGNYTKENCRWADDCIQAYNKRKYNNNTSGKTGVVLNKRSNKWVVTINVNKERLYIGTFINLSDAVSAREEAEIKFYGEPKGH